MSNTKTTASAASKDLKYVRISADIVRRIKTGEWPLGAKVPALSELTERYPGSRMTVLKALQSLVREGWLRTERGVGTFVARDRLQKTVGFLVSEDVLHPQATPFAYLLMRHCRVFLEKHGVSLKVYIAENTSPNGDLPAEGLDADLRNGRLSGLILSNCNAHLFMPNATLWRNHPVPLVDITLWADAPHHVVFDVAHLIRLALDACAAHSRHRIAAIGLSPAYRIEKAVQRAGFETRTEWIVDKPEDDPANTIRHHEQWGFDAMMTIWRATAKPDALIIGDDIIAKGVMQAVQQLAVRVPERLLILTQANRDSGIFYPLDAIRLEFDIEYCAQRAGTLLLKLIETPDTPPETICIRPRLVTSSKTATPKKVALPGL